MLQPAGFPTRQPDLPETDTGLPETMDIRLQTACLPCANDDKRGMGAKVAGAVASKCKSGNF